MTGIRSEMEALGPLTKYMYYQDEPQGCMEQNLGKSVSL